MNVSHSNISLPPLDTTSAPPLPPNHGDNEIKFSHGLPLPPSKGLKLPAAPNSFFDSSVAVVQNSAPAKNIITLPKLPMPPANFATPPRRSREQSLDARSATPRYEDAQKLITGKVTLAPLTKSSFLDRKTPDYSRNARYSLTSDNFSTNSISTLSSGTSSLASSSAD